MSWKEYSDSDKTIGDWLPWGGIIRPFILKNRDDSLLAVIEYEQLENEAVNLLKLPEMTNGWALWVEEQNRKGEKHHFITVLWNPFYSGDEARNTLASDAPVNEAGTTAYFEITVKSFKEELSKTIPCKLLVYQELLDFLSFALSLGNNYVKMPDTPLYINDLVSQDADVKFNTANNVIINNNIVLTVSLPVKPSISDMKRVLESIAQYPYRHVQRLLIFDRKAAEGELKKYTKAWCPGRNTIKELLTRGIIKNINCYYSNTLLILTDNYFDCMDDLRGPLDSLQLPYRVEDYNLRDVFWSSLPGIFRANITPPITGFNSLNELLFVGSPETENEDRYVPNGFI